MKAVLDTNVLISGAIAPGVPHEILVAGFSNVFQIIVSVETLTEFRATLLDVSFLVDPETVTIRLQRDTDPVDDTDPTPASPARPAVLDYPDVSSSANPTRRHAYDLSDSESEPLGDIPDIDAIPAPEVDPRPAGGPHHARLSEDIWQHTPTRTETS